MDLKEISQKLSDSTRSIPKEDRHAIRNMFDLILEGMEKKSRGLDKTIKSESSDLSKSSLDKDNFPSTPMKSSSEFARPKETLIQELYDCVVDFEDEKVAEVAQEYVEAGYDPYVGIQEGLIEGMNKVSQLYDDGEYFITDILLCSDAMYAGLDILRPYLDRDEKGNGKTAIIGVVEGDTHDIGKNLVKIMMETAGFNMVDLGRDVPLAQFAEAALESNADLICMSTLMTTTMSGMETVIQHLEEAGIRDKVKVMIGGGAITQKFCKEIGADAYTSNAVDAVKKAKELVGISA